jgi:hypothetical protein
MNGLLEEMGEVDGSWRDPARRIATRLSRATTKNRQLTLWCDMDLSVFPILTIRANQHN